MDQQPGFRIAVSQNKYLSTEDNEMHAVLTVTAGSTGYAVPELAEVIAIDCSGSMSYPPTKIAAAQRATRSAIDIIRDGARFAIVEGTDRAQMVYPKTPELVTATPETRRAAKNAVAALVANGGTAIGEWLRLARQLLVAHPTAVRHVILLTDGQNNRGPEVLEQELAACAPVFTCDSRGIGEDWEPRELLRIAAALHGSADAVLDPADLPADFTAMIQSAMDKLVPEVRILIGPSEFVSVDFLRQTYPTESNLDGQVDGSGSMVFATGSWGAESREFHLQLRVDSGGAVLDKDIRIARVDVQLRRPGSTAFERASDPANVFVRWTDNLKLSSIIDPKVAYYTDQTELGKAVLGGCDAHDAGDLTTATAEWGRAVALASRLGNDKVLTRLLRLVEVVGDPADGVVRIKASVRAGDLLSAAMGSVLSTMSPEGTPVTDLANAHLLFGDHDAATAPDAAEPDVPCENCHKVWKAGSEFCGGCGHRLGQPA